MAGCRGLGSQQQATSRKQQAKSKKGAHLSVRRLLVSSAPSRKAGQNRACRGLRGFVPIPQGGTTMASLMLHRVTAFPLHLCTVWSSWTVFFKPVLSRGRRDRTLFVPCIWQPSGASCRSRVAGFPPPLCTVWSVWTVCLEGQQQAASNKPQAKIKEEAE